MATFVVIPAEKSQQLEIEIKRFENKAYRLPNGEFLIAFEGTSRQLSDMLGITDGRSGTGIIFNISNYWGFAGKDVWEWLSVNGA